MSRETRVCPLCNGTLQFRLGEFICDSCEYRAPVELPKADQMRSKEDEVEDRRRRLIKPPPTPESQKQVFSPQDIDTTARVKFKQSGGPPPKSTFIQKVVVMCLQLLMGAIGILMVMPQMESYAFAHGQSSVVAMFFGMAVGLLLLGWGLFCNNLAVKYVFIVLSGLNVLTQVASIVLLIYASYSNVVATPGALLPFMGAVFYIMLLAGLWMSSWIFYLFYTDIQAMN